MRVAVLSIYSVISFVVLKISAKCQAVDMQDCFHTKLNSEFHNLILCLLRLNSKSYSKSFVYRTLTNQDEVQSVHSFRDLLITPICAAIM